MQVLQVPSWLFLVLIFLHEVQLKSFHTSVEYPIKTMNKSEPRIFFKQMMEASGLFPLEINVPDTISAMMGGIGSMYESVSSYFGGGSEASGDGQSQQDVVHDEVDLHSQPIKAKHRKKKVKKLKKKTENDDDENLFDYFGFLMF